MPTPTPQGPFKTNKEITIRGFHGGSRFSYPDFTLPAGLRCKPITEGGTAGKFFIDQFPRDIFPANAALTHDATHYGIVIEAADVDDLTPKVADWPTNKNLTPEALEAFRQAQSAPYATAQKDGKLLSIYAHFDGTYSVVHDRETIFGPDPDPQASIDAFRARYSA